jgi:catechol 2,3-dioxygenase-like lactoylglutathione lyase family enzyme
MRKKEISRRRYRAAAARWLNRSRQERNVFGYTRTIVLAALGAAMLASAPIAHADGVPGLRGHDHTGITVPDMKQASDFFVNVLGCKEAMSFGPFADDKTDFMTQLVNVNPRAVINQITLVRCGYGSNIELFQYTSPDQKNMTPKNSDIGGYHVAFYVDDIKAAKEYLDGKGVKTFFNLPVNEGPAAGQSILFPDAVGAADGSHQLPEGHGLRKDIADQAVVADRSG